MHKNLPEYKMINIFPAVIPGNGNKKTPLKRDDCYRGTTQLELKNKKRSYHRGEKPRYHPV